MQPQHPVNGVSIVSQSVKMIGLCGCHSTVARMLKIAVDHSKGRLYQFRHSKYCRHGIDGRM